MNTATTGITAPGLTATQKAIAAMVSDSIGFKWTSHNAADRAVAAKLLKQKMKKAPESLTPQDFQASMTGKPYKRTKAFLNSLADAMQDEIWKKL